MEAAWRFVLFYAVHAAQVCMCECVYVYICEHIHICIYTLCMEERQLCVCECVCVRALAYLNTHAVHMQHSGMTIAVGAMHKAFQEIGKLRPQVVCVRVSERVNVSV